MLGSLRYSTYMMHLQQQERQIIADAEKASRKASKGVGGGPAYTTPARSVSTQTGENTEAVFASMDAGTSQSYVSLG